MFSPPHSTKQEHRRRLSRGSFDVQTAHEHVGTGTPVDVPVPRSVTFVFKLGPAVSVFRIDDRAGGMPSPLLLEGRPEIGLQIDRVEGKIAKSLGQNTELRICAMAFVQNEHLFFIDGAPSSPEIAFFATHPYPHFREFGFELLNDLLRLHVDRLTSLFPP